MCHRSGLQIIRKSTFTAAPWKNGGGVTYEAIRVPASGDSFRWRVSVAHIDASGPFSDFAAYNRTMVLLRGSGVALKFAGGDCRELRRVGDLVEFDGAVSTHCDLLDGPCVDLNVMVSKSAHTQARIECVANELAVPGSPLASTLIFSIADPLWVHMDAGETCRLEPWDLAVMDQGGARLSRTEHGDLAAPSAVFFATISK